MKGSSIFIDMDDSSVTPPSWSSEPAATPPPAPEPANSAPPTSSPAATVSIDEAQGAFIEALETRLALAIQNRFGPEVLNEYLTMREKDDLAEMLMFEARHGFNLEHLAQEEQAKLLADMEAQLPGSSAPFIVTAPNDNQEEQNG